MEVGKIGKSLESTSQLPLQFIVEGTQLVPNDFHITEVKKVSIDAMDCGGNSDSWQELVIQLWSPDGDNDVVAMNGEKFLSIVQQTGYRALMDTLTVRIEYGDAKHPAVQYDVGDIQRVGDRLRVVLESPYVACKPRLNQATSCC